MRVYIFCVLDSDAHARLGLDVGRASRCGRAEYAPRAKKALADVIARQRSLARVTGVNADLTAEDFFGSGPHTLAVERYWQQVQLPLLLLALDSVARAQRRSSWR